MQSTSTSSTRFLRAALSTALCVAPAACGNGNNLGFTASDDGGADAEGGSHFVSPEAGDDSASIPACVDSVQTAQLLPLDLLFLLDRSELMYGPPWDASTRAMLEFLNQGFRSPTQIGLTLMPYATTEDVWGDQQGTGIDVCQYRVYTKPVVPLGPLAAQRAPFEKALAAALVPNSGYNGFDNQSTYYAGLQGTYFVATQAQAAHPDHQVVVVVVGEGVSTPCPAYGPQTTDPTAMAALASAALHYDGVRTFGISFATSFVATMDDISQAGGGVVYYPESSTTQALLDAMNNVQRAAANCTFALPSPPQGQMLDPTRVQVDVTSSTGQQTTLHQVSGLSQCGQQAGWYYDNGANPGKILFCPSSCDALQADPVARVELVLACSSVAQ